ncbi:MAG: hypothetical protein NTV34_01015, partial [Proteobacteria bacterium]|nr:hypothetical protein [Pseudomonadota bacterium]
MKLLASLLTTGLICSLSCKERAEDSTSDGKGLTSEDATTNNFDTKFCADTTPIHASMFQEAATYECVGNLALANQNHQNIIKISLKAFEPMNKSILATAIKCPEQGWLNCIEGLFEPTNTGLQSFNQYTSDGGLKLTRQAHLHRETGFIYLADTFYTGEMKISYTKYCDLKGGRTKGIAVYQY